MGAKVQGNLDGVFDRVKGPTEFTREGVLQAVARFIACDDQVRVENAEQVCKTDDGTGASSREQGNVPELPCSDETKSQIRRSTVNARCHDVYPQRVCCLAKRVEA